MKNSLLIMLLLLITVANALAQQTRPLTGRVLDGATGEALPGVTIVVKNSTIGTGADNNGQYSLNIPVAGDVTLIFSYVGYVTETVEVGSREKLDVSLKADRKALDEVVVIGTAK